MAPDDLLDLDVGAPAHGGACVARHEGRVVFVRHALPGERVRAVVTDDSGSYLRADAVEIVTPSADRVAAPCPHAGPGRCGGCDWQHASGAAQRAMKTAVVREQFARVAKLDVAPLLDMTEELPGGLLGWRTRVAYAVDTAGRIGLHRHRSHEVELLAGCPLGVTGVGDAAALGDTWTGASGLEAVRDDSGAVALIRHRPGGTRRGRGRRPPDRLDVVAGPEQLMHLVGERELHTQATGFWQVHPHALGALTQALLAALAPRAGETVLELYAGAGALTVPLADAVGASGRVVGVESDRRAVADAQRNLAGLPWASVVEGRAGAGSLALIDGRLDLVVLDPPRAGAGQALIAALVAAAPRAIGYVSCDPATLARDVRAALDAGADAGWTLAMLRAFDAFPMTHHVECVAVLAPADVEAPG